MKCIVSEISLFSSNSPCVKFLEKGKDQISSILKQRDTFKINYGTKHKNIGLNIEENHATYLNGFCKAFLLFSEIKTQIYEMHDVDSA